MASTTTPDVDRVRELAARVKDLRRQYTDAAEEMRRTLRAARDGGAGANELVRAAEGGMSRAKVFEALGALDLLADVRSALAKAGAFPHLDAFERGGRVFLTANVVDGPYEMSDFEDGTVERDARRVLSSLSDFDIPSDAAEQLAAYADLPVRRRSASS